MEAAGKLGKDFTHSRRYKKYLEAAGFVDVQEKHFQWAKGERLKIMGMLFRQELVHGLDGVAMALLTRGLGMEPAKVKEWVEEARGNLLDKDIHAYMPGYDYIFFIIAFEIHANMYRIVVYGRKPEKPTS